MNMDLSIQEGHLCNMGRMIEEMESKLRNSLDQVQCLSSSIHTELRGGRSKWSFAKFLCYCGRWGSEASVITITRGFYNWHLKRKIFRCYCRFTLGRRKKWFVLCDRRLKWWWDCLRPDLTWPCQMTRKLLTISLFFAFI